MSFLKTILRRRDLVANLVGRELKGKYKGSALGILWSLLTPLFMSIVYMFFLSLLARGVPMSQILIGVFAWQFTVGCVNDGMNSITGNGTLVKKVFFPRVILPVSVTLANLVNYLLSLVVQFPLIYILLTFSAEHGAIGAGVWLLPVVILYHLFFNLGLALLLSASNVYFRDTQHLVGVLMSAWFFLSPAMYNYDLVRGFAADYPLVADLYLLNPLACVFETYRALILTNVDLPMSPWYVAGLAWPVLLIAVAYVVFQKAQKNFADML